MLDSVVAPNPLDKYLGPVPTVVELNGSEFWVNVHLAEVDGRYICVGIDLRSFEEIELDDLARIGASSTTSFTTSGERLIHAAIRRFEAPPAPGKNKPVVIPMNDRFVEVTSPVVRALRTSEVIETAQAPIRDLLLKLADSLQTTPASGLGEGVPQLLSESLEEPWKPMEQKKRGPRPLLDDTALRDIVAVTYRVTAKRPVQAVRVALEESGVLGSRVTIDQARKAVAAARAKSFIPPATRVRKQQEET
jgi:hypothetical protein